MFILPFKTYKAVKITPFNTLSAIFTCACLSDSPEKRSLVEWVLFWHRLHFSGLKSLVLTQISYFIWQADTCLLSIQCFTKQLIRSEMYQTVTLNVFSLLMCRRTMRCQKRRCRSRCRGWSLCRRWWSASSPRQIYTGILQNKIHPNPPHTLLYNAAQPQSFDAIYQFCKSWRSTFFLLRFVGRITVTQHGEEIVR